MVNEKKKCFPLYFCKPETKKRMSLKKKLFQILSIPGCKCLDDFHIKEGKRKKKKKGLIGKIP